MFKININKLSNPSGLINTFMDSTFFMKRFFLAFYILVFYNTVMSQATTGSSMQKDFDMISNLGKAQTGYESFQTYTSGAVDGSQFLPDNWCNGSVTTVNNEVINKYLFIYDKVKQNLYIKTKDSNLVVLADKSQISSFILQADKTYSFAKASVYDPSLADGFLEILVSGNYTLLKTINTTFEKADPSDLERARLGNHNDAFVDHNTYYIYYDHKLQKIKLTENSLRKTIGSSDLKLNDFLNAHQQDNIDEDYLINLVTSLNVS